MGETEAGRRLAGAKFDHFFHRGLNRPEHGWLICQACYRELTHGGYVAQFERMPEFRRFQAAVLAQRQRTQKRPVLDQADRFAGPDGARRFLEAFRLPSLPQGDTLAAPALPARAAALRTQTPGSTDQSHPALC